MSFAMALRFFGLAAMMGGHVDNESLAAIVDILDPKQNLSMFLTDVFPSCFA